MLEFIGSGGPTDVLVLSFGTHPYSKPIIFPRRVKRGEEIKMRRERDGYPAYGIAAWAIGLFSRSSLLCNMASAEGDEMYNVKIHQRIIPYQRRQPSMDSVLCREWHGLMHSFRALEKSTHIFIYTRHPSVWGNLHNWRRVDARHVLHEQCRGNWQDFSFRLPNTDALTKGCLPLSVLGVGGSLYCGSFNYVGLITVTRRMRRNYGRN